MVVLRRSASVGRRPTSDLPLTPLIGLRNVHHKRRVTVDTDEQASRRPADTPASPLAQRSSSPVSKQCNLRPWTRDSLAPPSTADEQWGSRHKTPWPVKPELEQPKPEHAQRNSRSTEHMRLSLTSLPSFKVQRHGSASDILDAWQSPLLEAEVELHAPRASVEERGVLAVQLLGITPPPCTPNP